MKAALCKCDSSGQVQHDDCFAGSLRSHKETRSDSTASLKTAFIGANTIMERTVQIILHSFRCWEPWAVQHQPGLRSRCSTSRRSCPWKSYTILIIQAITGFSYKERTLYIISTAKQYCCSQENLLLHFQMKSRPRRGDNHGYQVGAAHRPLWYNQLGKFIPRP